jgi:hypothetical protein
MHQHFYDVLTLEQCAYPHWDLESRYMEQLLMAATSL